MEQYSAGNESTSSSSETNDPLTYDASSSWQDTSQNAVQFDEKYPLIRRQSHSSPDFRKSYEGYMLENFEPSHSSTNTGGNSNPNTSLNQQHDYVKTKDEDLLYAKLKDALKSEAATSTRMTSPIPGKKFQYVPLSITICSQRQVQKLDHTVHYQNREEVLKLFKPSKGNRELKDLFAMAKARRDTDEGKYCCSNQFCCNAIGVTGQAGVGKTSICKHLLDVVLQDSLWKFEIVFYILIRNINFEEKYDNLLQFLMTASLSQWNFCKEEDETLLKLLSHDTQVLLIMDGLDEAGFSQIEKRAPTVLFHKSAKAEHYLKNILCGNLLPHATKFVTSRPRQLFEMHPDCRPHFVSEIVGLSEAAKDDLCRQICGENSDKVKKFLTEYPNIAKNCYVPVTCILTLNAVHMRLTGRSGAVNCDTVTGIMIHTFEQLIISPHVRVVSHKVVDELVKLTHLAEWGISNGQITFYERDFRTFNIDREMVHAFLQTRTDSNVTMKILDGKMINCFSHLTWQEFFAAVYMILFMDNEDFSEQEGNFSKSKYEVCVKFMMGICNSKNFRCLQTLFDHKTTDLSAKLKVLKQFVLKTMNGLFDSGKSKITFLQVCSWVYEAKDEELRKIVAQNLPSKLDLKGTILPSDVNSLHYVLSSCTKPCEIKVKFRNYVADSFVRFFRGLVTTLENSKVSLTSIDADEVESITDEGINHMSKCLDHIEIISMRVCNISSRQLEMLAKGLEKLQKPMKNLDLSENMFGNEGVKQLVSCLSKIEKLNMSSCNIRASGVGYLSTALKNLPQPIKSLYLSENKLGNEGMKKLASALSKIEELGIGKCEIRSSGIENLSNGICKLLQPMKILDISENKLGDEGAKKLAPCLSKVERLYIRTCGIHASGIASLSNAIKQLPQPLKSVDLYGNAFRDEGVLTLASTLKKVEKLRIDFCSIGAIGIEYLASGLNELQQPMKGLYISDNKFGDEGAKALASCLNKIDKLCIESCGITSSGIDSLSVGLNKLSLPMQTLNLHGNKFGDEGAKSLASCLSKIEEVVISNCHIGETGMECLWDAMDKLPQPKPRICGSRCQDTMK